MFTLSVQPFTSVITNLTAGYYSVTITDVNGCTDSVNITITQPAAALSTTIIGTDVACFGEATGNTDLTVTGETTPYLYFPHFLERAWAQLLQFTDHSADRLCKHPPFARADPFQPDTFIRNAKARQNGLQNGNTASCFVIACLIVTVTWMTAAYQYTVRPFQ